MMVETQKTNARVKLLPQVTFITGLPHREVSEADKDGLNKGFEVKVQLRNLKMCYELPLLL
jgi:hypothetical protein